MELMAALFERQHIDIEKLSKSSNRLEKLTYHLIGLAAGLIVITILEKFFHLFEN